MPHNYSPIVSQVPIAALPRLALIFVLKGRCKPGFLVVLATKCSSMVGINVGTSGRSKCNSTGLLHVKSVLISNALTERTACMVCYACFVRIIFQTGIQSVARLCGRQAPSRTSLLCLVISCLNGTWVVEQPGSSVLEYFPAFRFMMNALIRWHGLGCVI